MIATAKTGVKGLQKLDQFGRGPQEFRELASELESIERLLADISTFATQNGRLSYRETLFEHVKRAREKIDQINELMNPAHFRLFEAHET